MLGYFGSCFKLNLNFFSLSKHIYQWRSYKIYNIHLLAGILLQKVHQHITFCRALLSVLIPLKRFDRFQSLSSLSLVYFKTCELIWLNLKCLVVNFILFISPCVPPFQGRNWCSPFRVWLPEEKDFWTILISRVNDFWKTRTAWVKDFWEKRNGLCWVLGRVLKCPNPQNLLKKFVMKWNLCLLHHFSTHHGWWPIFVTCHKYYIKYSFLKSILLKQYFSLEFFSPHWFRNYRKHT